MESKMEKATRILSLPKSVFLEPTMNQKLANEYWTAKCSHTEYSLLMPSEGEQWRPISSFSPQILLEFHLLLADWRSEARERVACMEEKERQSILASVGIQAFSEDVLFRKDNDLSDSSCIKKSSQKNHITSVSWRNSSFVSGMRKRKPTQLVRGSRPSKFGRPSSYSQNSLWSRKLCYNKPILKRRNPKKTFVSHERLKKTMYSQGDSQYLDEDDDEEEDQLTSIVSRQRQAFSARVAAGRPSIRKIQPHLEKKPGGILCTTNNVPAARRLSAKVLRAWKSMAKKTICKMARQRVANRRDKMIIAKRAARECARLLRQKALLSQKAARDSISRGHRLSREITSNWRNSTSSVVNGSAPLTINGITMPSCSNTTHFSSFMDLSDYYASIGSESRGLESNTSTSVMESSTAARRRAEKAAAEQRKADLELLEARRQQRKLNFLITQTELYAHFMAKKMADVHSDNYKSEHINGTCRSENPEIVFSNVDQENSSEEAEARRILRRLEEVDDDSVEIKANEEGTDTGSDLSTPLDSVQNDQDYIGISSGSNYRKSYSSIAVAAKAAACRLGINAEEEYDVEQAKSEALMKVKAAVTVERNRVSQFHTGTSAYHNLSTSAFNNTDVTTAPTQIEAPKLFKGQLKAYQVRGLNWLLGLFDQGINGILADEMGLGKTIQTVAFLGCLAENYNIWGPFLIVTPASTLHNWTQEFAKFLPAFRLVPYWGTPAERKVLRRFWSSTRSSKAESSDESGDIATGHTGTKHSELHVVITSYQVVLQDAKFINKTSWSYIVLDEAHAIKSTSSLRWKILLSFKCRNRLLLTGTPIQNTMQELWALLHFIMPTLFDSHDEFANWFSRDIESQASATARTSSSSVSGGGGSGTGSLITSKLNENQLSRLHLILKPFMLRRTKAEVEHEISTKTEIMLYCPLSHRQQILYERLRNKIRLEDLSSIMCTNGMSDNFSSNLDHPNSSAAAATAHLINLVMQLRKVCNHPDLWERRDVRFSCITGQIEPSSCRLSINNSDIKYHAYNNSRDEHALWRLPNLLYENDALSLLSWRAKSLSSLYPEWPSSSFNCYSIRLFNIILKYFNLYHPSYIHEDLWHHDDEEPDLGPPCMLNQRKTCTSFPSKCFSFTRLLGLSVNDYVKLVRNGRYPLSSSQSNCNNQWTSKSEILAMKHYFDEECIMNRNVFGILKLGRFFPMDYVHIASCSISQLLHLYGLLLCQVVYESSTILSDVPSVFIHYPGMRPFIPNFVSAATTHKVLINPLKPYINTLNYNISHIDSLLSCNVTIPLPRSLELVSRDTRISDSGKLTALDNLLTELKANGHRILIYSQMTRMIDILEEFMLYRKHAYLRLDGSSRLSDRRDMVAQWQTNPRWFVFLLSTRAGGLGINLTAADTVIFYDSDWNPTVDQQAMDRAHRLGQTKPVTVYRLICKNTVEGRMLRRAEEKRAMQQMVIQSGQAGLSNLLPNVANRSGPTEHMTSSDMVSLLLDDDELVKRLQIRRRLQPQRGRPTKNQLANRLIVPSTTVKVSSNITNLSNTDSEMSGTKQQSSEDFSSTELSLHPQRTSDINSVDENSLGRKRQAAYAEQSTGECVKKIRPMKADELATISTFGDPVITCNSDNNNTSNNVT